MTVLASSRIILQPHCNVCPRRGIPCLGSLAPEDGWHVRAFSPGELVSLLFAVHERVAWVLPDPLPDPLAGRTPANDDRLPTVGRDEFIAQLVRR